MPTGTSGSPVTISYTVSYSMGADSKNKDQGWVLLSYLTGKEGMTMWTAGGVALPSRKDVPTPAGKDVLASEVGLCQARLGLHARLQRRPEGVPGRVHSTRSRRRRSTPARSSTRPRRPSTRHSASSAPTTVATTRPAALRSIASAGASPGANRAGRSRATRRGARRSEAVAGYLFVAVPMALFLVLNIGALIFAAYISVWRWNLRTGPVTFLGPQELRGRARPTRPSSAPSRTRSTTRSLWVPLTMAIGLFLAVVVNQKIRGQTFFRAAFYFPAIASSAAITTLWIFIVSPDGLFNGIRARHRPRILCSALFGLPARTRTGSTTRTRRSTR